MALASIAQKGGEIGDGAEQVDDDEDGAYGYVLMDSGDAANNGHAGREVWRLQSGQSVYFGEEVVMDVIYPLNMTSLAYLKHHEWYDSNC